MLDEREVRARRGSLSQYLTVVLAAAAFVLVAIAFASDVTEDKPAGPAITSADDVEASGNPVVELGEMYIEGDLAVDGGATLAVANRGVAPHNLVIENGPRTPDLDSEKGFELDLAGVAAGTHTVYCAIEGHRAAGMEAELVVGAK